MIRRHADEIAYNEAREQEDDRLAEPVIMPAEEGTDDLHWEFPFGPSSLYCVNAKTGKVITRKTRCFEVGAIAFGHINPICIS